MRTVSWKSWTLKIGHFSHAQQWHCFGLLYLQHSSTNFLARSANLPTGLPSVISSFFLLGAKLSQYLLDRFSRSFHQMEGICVNYLDQVHFFQFLKGRCHGNQFCVVSKTQTACDFCNFYTIWKPFGCRWWIWNFFSISQGMLPWQSILFRTGLVRSEPKYLRIRWTDFHNLCTIW